MAIGAAQRGSKGSGRVAIGLGAMILGVMLCAGSPTAAADDPPAKSPQTARHAKPKTKQPWWIVRQKDLVIPNETRIGSRNTHAWLLAMLSRVEPYRYVPAEEWYSPYCLAWDDGSIQCTRAKVEDEPKCQPIPDAEVKPAKDREVIECSRADLKMRDELCASSYTALKTGTITSCSAIHGDCMRPIPLRDHEFEENIDIWPKYTQTGDGAVPVNVRMASRNDRNVICDKALWTTNDPTLKSR